MAWPCSGRSPLFAFFSCSRNYYITDGYGDNTETTLCLTQLRMPSEQSLTQQRLAQVLRFEQFGRTKVGNTTVRD